MPIGEKVLQKRLIGASPECVGLVEFSHHTSKGDATWLGDKNAAVHSAEIPQPLIHIRGRHKFRIAKQLIDILHHNQISIEKNDPLKFLEFPQAQLGEVVERIVKNRLVAFGERSSGVLSFTAVAGAAWRSFGRETRARCVRTVRAQP